MRSVESCLQSGELVVRGSLGLQQDGDTLGLAFPLTLKTRKLPRRSIKLLLACQSIPETEKHKPAGVHGAVVRSSPSQQRGSCRRIRDRRAWT